MGFDRDNDSAMNTTSVSQYRKTLLSALKERKFVEFDELVNSEYFDVNYFYEDPDNGTLLDIACRSSGNSEFVRILLQKYANPNILNKVTGKAVIHEAVENSDSETVELLTTHLLFDSVNVVDRYGNTPLHLAVKNHRDTEFLRILLGSRGQPVDINISTKGNPTALHLALNQRHLEAARVLLSCSNVDLDLQRDSQNRTCRKIIQQDYPQLHQYLPDRSLYRPGDILNSLLARGEVELFANLAGEVEERILNDEYNGETFLHWACDYGYDQIVDILLKRNVDPNKVCKSRTPIMLAAQNGYHEIFQRLLDHPNIRLQIQGFGSVLHSIIQGMYHCQSRASNHYKCLELSLNNQIDLDIDFVDSNNCTALHLAVLYSDERVQKSLVFSGAHLYRKNTTGEIPLTLIKPQILEEYLDDCISCDKTSRIETNYEIFFDYRFLRSSENYTHLGYENEFFSILEGIPELRQYLKHPVSESYLQIKWHLFRKYYYANLIFYFVFCSTLSWYIYYETPPNIHISTPLNFFWQIVIPMFFGMLVSREVYLFLVSPGSYLSSPEKWLEKVAILITGVFYLYEETTLNIRSAYVALILASWTRFMFLMGKHSLFSIHVEIFKTVAISLIKFCALYSIMIVSFAFSFYILFSYKPKIDNSDAQCSQNSTPNYWKNPPLAFFKTVIMMTGEFSIESIPFHSSFCSEHMFFILFVFFITMIVYNILSGLVVSDIHTLREDAKLVDLVSRVRLITQLELLANCNPFRWLGFISPSMENQCLSFYNRVYRDNIWIYPMTSPETHVAVRPYEKNAVHLKRFKRKCFVLRSCKFEKIYTLEMPSSIMKEAIDILQCRNAFELIDDIPQNLEIHAVKKYPPKFPSVDALGQYFIAQMRDLKIELDEKNSKRDEKLLRNVEALMSDFEAKIDRRIETILESKTDKMI